MNASALYTGATRHRRRWPRRHDLRAKLAMVLLDHDELADPAGPTRRGGPLGPEWWWPVRYRRSDYLDGDEDVPLDTAVRDLVEARTGVRPEGSVQTLTQVRTEGYVFNPLTVHYCAAPGGRHDGPPEVVVLEVTNTPWKERHCYVVDARTGAARRATPGPVAVGRVDPRGRLHAEIPKALHVSPFMPMDQRYRFTCSGPGDRLWLRLETLETDPDRPGGPPRKVFDADLALRRRTLTRRTLARELVTHPFATYRVWLGIHAHAAVLAAQRVPFVPHPDRGRRATSSRASAPAPQEVDRPR